MILKSLLNYNLFLFDENDYDDDDDIKDPAIVLKHQKYKTWLYVALLTACLYILFYISLIKVESETVVVSDVTRNIFDELSSKHGQSLSCPCTRTTVPYKNFVFNNITKHPVCESIFVDKQWIERLYFDNASLYAFWDFRTTAFSQFQLLSKFCSISKEIRTQTETNINNTEFVTLELLSELQVKDEVISIVEIQKNNAYGRIISYLSFLKTTIKAHFFITALSTNWVVGVDCDDDYRPLKSEIPSYYPGDLTFPQMCGADNFVFEAFVGLDLREPTKYNGRYGFVKLEEYKRNVVKGFFAACTPLEAIYESTLECLYEMQCIQLVMKYFPKLNQIKNILNNSVLSSEHKNISVINHLNTLFIENWSVEINYLTYFDQCSPSRCTYTRNNHVNLSYGITLFISLYGGLIIILRLVASFLIDILFKSKNHSRNSNFNSNHQTMNIFKPIQSIKRLNLFKNIHDRTEKDITEQKITTRFYLILLIENRYSTTLRCPCRNKTIFHRIFMSFSPVFHQICSSTLIDDDWIYLLKLNGNNQMKNDWRNHLPSQLRLLSDLCQLGKRTISDALDRFLTQKFIASSIMNKNNFDKQIIAFVTQFYNGTIYNFDLLKDIIHLLTQVDQLHMGSLSLGLDNSNMNMFIEIVNNARPQIQLVSNGILEVNTKLITCYCAINPYCQSSAVLYDEDFFYGRHNNISYTYNVSGWIHSCLAIDSLLSSTLQCLNIYSDCFPIILNYLAKFDSMKERINTLTYRIHPLVYDPTVSHFPLNTSISKIVSEMMVEQWNFVSSYEKFYDACAPIFCSYFQEVREENFTRVIIKLISVIGGIIVLLRILTPHIVKFISKLPTLCRKKSNQTRQDVLIHRHLGCIDRLNKVMQNLLKLIHNTLVELNIFSSRDFGNNIDRLTAKRYGQWATRLYTILFTSCIISLISYTTIQPQTLIKNFEKPSLTYYSDLRNIYGDELICTCSRIASTYQQFVNIQPAFHSVCESDFVKEEWRLSLVNGLVPDLNVYERKDYRRFLSAHLQYLQGLCKLSQKSVDNSINELLTSLLVTIELLSNSDFNHRLNILIEQSKTNVPVFISGILFFTQSIIHENAFISLYGTNFEYLLLNKSCDGDVVYSPTKAFIYDNGCSCGFSSNCATQATFIETKLSENKSSSVKGMKMGCTPSESFLLSTLECFYDQTCINRIQQYTKYKKALIPLSTTNLNRFSPDTIISKLVENLFIENWTVNVNYSSYYEQCSPLVCSYTSGLTIVLKWICPKLIRIGFKIYNHRKKQKQSIHPIEDSINKTPNTTTENTPVNERSERNVISHSRPHFKIKFLIILFLCIFASIIIFSIYHLRQNLTTTASVVFVSNTTVNTTMSTFTTTTTSEPICYPKFEHLTINSSCSEMHTYISVAFDINADNRIDLIFVCYTSKTFYVLLGNGNVTFQKPILPSLSGVSYVDRIYFYDMNNDGLADLINVKYMTIVILFRKSNEILEIEHSQTLDIGFETGSIVIIDLNRDKKLDIVITLSKRTDIYV
ncbi:hypothetical protein I4U23_005284, partial [Adineta vaga]